MAIAQKNYNGFGLPKDQPLPKGKDGRHILTRDQSWFLNELLRRWPLHSDGTGYLEQVLRAIFNLNRPHDVFSAILDGLDCDDSPCPPSVEALTGMVAAVMEIDGDLVSVTNSQPKIAPKPKSRRTRL